MSTIQTLIDSQDDIATNEDIIESWFLMGSPTPTITIVGTYLYFVLRLGPQMMASRKPYSLQPLLVAYNFILVLFSLFLAIWAFTSGMLSYLLREACRPTPRGQHEFSKSLNTYAWWYLITKIIELADTVFFVLRKKQGQITFLHVYHHSSLVFFSWCYLKYMPVGNVNKPKLVPVFYSFASEKFAYVVGLLSLLEVPAVVMYVDSRGQGAIIGFLNSIVHVIMYFYYMVAAMGPKYQKYLWWKKYITRIQLTQFVVMLAFLGSLLVRDCHMPKILSVLMGTNVFFFLCLFTNFYFKTYKEKKNVA